MVMSAVSKKNADRVLELVRTGELTHLQKSWALSQAAKLLSKTDRDKALAVLDDATAEARRLEGADPDRPRALIAVANAMLTLDRGKAWDAVEEIPWPTAQQRRDALAPAGGTDGRPARGAKPAEPEDLAAGV